MATDPMRKIFIISDFGIDLSEDCPLEMTMDDIVDAARDNSTIYFESVPVAKSKRNRNRAKYTYTLTIKKGLTDE